MAVYETLNASWATKVVVDTTSVLGRLYFGFAMDAEPSVDLPASDVVTHAIPPESAPPHAMAILLEALREQIDGGGLLGFPLRNIRIVVTAVEYQEGTSSEVAIRVAACTAFREFLQSADLIQRQQ